LLGVFLAVALALEFPSAVVEEATLKVEEKARAVKRLNKRL
jgi:hypothetical protein